MKSTEERIKKLEIWNRVLLTAVALSVLSLAANSFLQKTSSSLQSLSIYQGVDGEIHLHSVSDSAKVVTHLVKYGDSEIEKKTAVLPQPLAIVDSAGARITAEEVKKLVWLDIYGRTTAPPVVGSKIKALYFSASTTSVRD